MVTFTKQPFATDCDKYSSVVHLPSDLSIFVSAAFDRVRVNMATRHGSSAAYYTVDEARALAAELMAAADSLSPAAIPVPEVTEIA